jgi:hypothetical protein
MSLTHLAHAKISAAAKSSEIIDMFVLRATPGPTEQFKLLSPRLQNITPFMPGDVQRALTHGLFGTVMLHYMGLNDGVPAATAAAETLRDACAAASRMAWVSGVPLAAPGPSSATSPSSRRPAELGWISELQDVAHAFLCVTTGIVLPDDMDSLLRIQEANAGPRKMLANAFKKEPWLTMARDTWKYGLGTLTILPKIEEALRNCASDPEAWVKAATLISTWKDEVRPGATLELDELLWKVLAAAWDKFDPDDQQGSAALLKRVRLARHLMSPNKPDTKCIDLMEQVAPRPQLIVPARRLGPRLKPHTLLILQRHTLDHAMRFVFQVEGNRSCRQVEEAGFYVPDSCEPGAAQRHRHTQFRPGCPGCLTRRRG